jgi:hypothetical protein
MIKFKFLRVTAKDMSRVKGEYGWSGQKLNNFDPIRVGQPSGWVGTHPFFFVISQKKILNPTAPQLSDASTQRRRRRKQCSGAAIVM